MLIQTDARIAGSKYIAERTVASQCGCLTARQILGRAKAQLRAAASADTISGYLGLLRLNKREPKIPHVRLPYPIVNRAMNNESNARASRPNNSAPGGN